MRIDVLTIFPKMFDGIITESIVKRAINDDVVSINIIDFREFANNKHKKVDDYPYGGGQGMVLSVQPVVDALRDIDGYETAHKVIMTPQGSVWNQELAYEYTNKNHLIIFAGHYEGYDERIYDYFDEEISIGDYVLTGGEIPAMIMIDSITRLLEGAIGNEESHLNDSFSNILLEGPQYTRPEEFEGKVVPKVLLSGHHKNINEFRHNEAINKTKKKRPDLYKKYLEKQSKE